MKKFIPIIFAIALMISCTQDKENGDDFVFSAPQTMVLTKTEKQALSDINAFGFNLLGTLPADQYNLIISPLSVSVALSMLEGGACNNTADEIADVLGLSGLTPTEINEFYYKLLNDILNQDEKVEFSIANSIWINSASQYFSISPEFKESCKFYYDSDSEVRDFKNDDVVGDMNSWVMDKTHGKIEEIVRSVSPESPIELVNAIYFKGGWGLPFDPDSEDIFHGDEGPEEVNFINLWNLLEYETGDSFRMVSIPYDTGEYNMAIILPKDESISVSSAMDEVREKWSELGTKICSESDKSYVDFKMPSFKSFFYGNIASNIYGLGITDAFSDKADFSTMFEKQSFDYYVQRINHVAYISVDRNGSEAAAATNIGIDGSSGDNVMPEAMEFHADRPFGYIIYEKKAGTVIFLGTKVL